MTATAPIDDAEPKPEVLLIDLSSLYWAAWHSSGEDEVSAARRRTLESVYRCVGDRTNKLIAICCDSGPSFRKDLAPEYKANRPEKDHAAIGELERVIETLSGGGYLIWGAPGFEADDVIATACGRAVMAGHAVTIASADKDLLQLLAYTKVTALRTHNWTTADANLVADRFGVYPDQLGDWLALVGDASDNIRGAPGIGPKTAAALLTKYKSLDAIWDALESDPKSVGTPAIVRSLQQNVEGIQLARKLVTLRTDAPIDFEEIYEDRMPASPTPEDEDMDAPHAEYDDVISRGPGPAADQPQSTADKTPPPEPKAAPATNGNGSSKVASTADAEIVETRALVAASPQFELALEPSSLGTAFKLAGALWDSRLYTRFPNKEAIMAVIIRGREMGLGALTSLDVFHVIEGKPAMHAHLIIARAEGHCDCEYFMLLHSDNEHAEYETKNRRHPKPIKHRYTIQDAIDAGLCTKEIAPRPPMGQKDTRGQWDKRRAEMLRKTAGVQLVRIAYPSAALGLYSVEEIGGGDA